MGKELNDLRHLITHNCRDLISSGYVLVQSGICSSKEHIKGFSEDANSPISGADVV